MKVKFFQFSWRTGISNLLNLFVEGVFIFAMASFRKAREMLTVAYTDNLISDEEFLLLYDLNKSKNLELPYDEHDKFDLGNPCEDECSAEFRFEKKDITRLAEVLQLPSVFKCPQGSVSDDIEGLCMLLRRLAYPVRYSDVVNRFARPVPVISMITNRVLDFIYETHHHRITSWNNSILYPAALQKYADAIFDQGAALNNSFGFVDRTVRPICRPDENQRIVFNGHKRVHAMKFQLLPFQLDICMDQ